MKMLLRNLAVLAGAITASHAAADCRQHKYAVYLSPGFEAGVPWGGYHVTVTGFSADHVCGGSMEAVLRDAWHHVQKGHAYSFKKKVKGKDYKAHEFKTPKGPRWGIVFKSSMLTSQLAPMLRKGGFKELKSQWHVSLYSNSDKSGVSKFESRLKDREWRLYLVPLPGRPCQDSGKGCNNDWLEIR